MRSLESHLDWPVAGTRDLSGRALRRAQGFLAPAFRAGCSERDAVDLRSARPGELAADTRQRRPHALLHLLATGPIFYEAVQAELPGRA